MTETKLDALKCELQQRGLSVSLRGGGRSAFLFVEHDGKAVEIFDHEGHRWVEFSDASEDEDELRRKIGPSRHPVRPSTRRLAGSCHALKEGRDKLSAHSPATHHQDWRRGKGTGERELS